jgi:hypothetical protein
VHSERACNPAQGRDHRELHQGEFSDFHGNRYRFLGPSRKVGDFMIAKYALMDLRTREIADGSMASGYTTNMGIFKALCPAQAHRTMSNGDLSNSSASDRCQKVL